MGLYTNDGKPIRQIHRNESFVLKVGLTDAPQSLTKNQLTIAGIDSFDTISQTQQLSVVNGNRSVIYHYELATDVPGFYKLGPAVFDDRGVQHQSNAIVIEVLNAQAPYNAPEDTTTADVKKPTFTIDIDKKKAYVGEKITCYITCRYAEQNLDLKNILSPSFSDWNIIEPVDESGIRDVVDGITYVTKKIRLTLAAKEPGTQHIGQFIADLGPHDNTLHNFIAMFGLSATTHASTRPIRLSTPVQAITIEALPPIAADVQGIGDFTDFTASINQTSITCGEGVSLTLELTGNGNFTKSDITTLTGMPDSCKWFTSQNQTVEQSSARTIKRFEFIVQAMKPGMWEIPPQKFLYFDPEQRQYYTISTQPLTLHVKKPARDPKHTTLQEPEPEAKPVLEYDNTTNNAPDTSDKVSVLAQINEGPWYPQPYRSLPWYIFMALMSMPVLYVLFQKIIAYVATTYIRANKHRKQAYRRSVGELHRATQERACHKLLSIFSTGAQSHNSINAQELDTFFSTSTSQALHDEWKHFIEQITHCAYATHTHDKQELDNLFAKAQIWIKRMNE